MKATIAIRADYSPEIGSGHYMRCRTLAVALRKRGCRIVFMFRYLPEFCQEELRALGFELLQLQPPVPPAPAQPADYTPPRHASWLGVSALEDAGSCLKACSGRRPFDWLIVDHYALDALWEKATKPFRRHLMVIDDLADRPHDCDLLLDQNCYHHAEHRYENLVPASCQCLLGARYAILREQFRTARERMTLRRGPVGRLLIFMGGSDVGNHTQRVMNALVRLPALPKHIEVITSRANVHIESLRASCARLGWDCITDTPDMAAHMLAADAAIGAAGSTNLERFCLGLPSFVLSVAHNQERMLEDCGKQGLLQAHVQGEDLEEELLRFLADNKLREAMSERCAHVVDGLGTDRILSALQTISPSLYQEQEA